MNNSKVLVITLNYNQVDYTKKCIKSLLDSKYDNFKIILIDNGSTEENYAELKRVIPNSDKILIKRIEKNIGYVGGVNFGLKECLKMDSEYIIIMNNDTIMHEEAIGELVASCKRHNNKAIVTGKVFYYDSPEILQTTGNRLINKKTFKTLMIGKGEKDIGLYDKEEERDMIDDIFWLFPTKLVHDIGFYSNWYGFGWEQADYAQRAKDRNYQLIYTPFAKLLHKENASVGHKVRTPYKVFWSIQGHLMFKWTYLSKISFLRSYFNTIGEISIAFVYDLIHIFNPKFENRLALIKLAAFIRFHLWIIFKMPSNKCLPNIVK